MRKVAKLAAIIGFFVLAFVGWCSGVPVFICGLRAIAGAAVLYFVISLAGTMAIRIIVDAAISTGTGNINTGKKE